MKRHFLLSFLAMLAFSLSGAPRSQAQTPARHALLIGAHLYERHNGKFEPFVDLDTESDVQAIRQALIDHFHFDPKEITVLTAKKDTDREALLKAIRQVLIDPVKPGDIVYFHYSGHGSEVPDASEPNGFDQTIVPTDFADDGSRDIRDKEIAKLIKEIEAKHPSNITLTFDCCHSGSITRGEKLIVRGKNWADRFPPGQAPPAPPAVQPEPDAPHLRGPAAGTGYVVISACRDNQTAAEMQDPETHQLMGRMSYVLVNTLRDAGPTTTYRDVFERLDSTMRAHFDDHEQNPQVEGQLDKPLFSGTASPRLHYILVDPRADGKLSLRAGSLQGMTRGSRFALYKSGAQAFKPAEEVAEAKIVGLSVTDAVLQVEKKVAPDFKPQNLLAGRAVEIEHQYGDNRLLVDPQEFHDLPQAPAILAQLKSLEAVNTEIKPGQQPSVHLLRDAGQIKLVRADVQSVITELSAQDDLPTQVHDALKREAQWRFVKALNNENNAGIRIEMRVVPANPPADLNNLTFASDKTPAPTPLAFGDGEYATIEVRNLGAQPAYVVVLDLESDGTVKQIWPDPSNPITDNVIKPVTPGDKEPWHKLWTPNGPKDAQLFTFSKPYGTEIFKALATPQPADFSGLETRAARGPLEMLFKLAQEGKRAEGVRAPTSWASATAAFEVKTK